MCGRFTLATSNESFSELFESLEVPALPPRYNIAPTQKVLCVRQSEKGDLETANLKWGLFPSWARQATFGARMINARSETAATKPAFRAAFKRRRCLVLADGFYEWQKIGTGKQPYYIQVNKKLFCMAGLWESWRDKSEDDPVPLESCTVLTTAANEFMQPLHDRMPVILDPDQFDLWLDREFEEPLLLEEMLKPYANEAMSAFPVSTFVNRPVNDSPECIVPIEKV